MNKSLNTIKYFNDIIDNIFNSRDIVLDQQTIEDKIKEIIIEHQRRGGLWS